MKADVRNRVIRDTALIFFGIVLLVALLLWGAWHVDFGIPRQNLIRVIAIFILVGFALFVVLFLVLLWTERANHYQRERTSALHTPLLISTAALMVYFGIASISAVDVYYDPSRVWPLMRDPTIQLITSGLILVIVGAKAWLLFEILPRQSWMRRKS